MNLRKMITITASATIIATSFSSISNIESNLIIVKADSKNEISNEQFDSDMNAASMAMSIARRSGFTLSYLNILKADDGNRLASYTGGDDDISFKGLLSGITNSYLDDDNSSSDSNRNIVENYDDDGNDISPVVETPFEDEYTRTYSAVKYLYNHFYNRFDPSTQSVLSSYYNNSSDEEYCDLASNLGDAIQNWGEQFDSVAPSPREIQENNAKEQENKAKKQARINRKNASNRKVKISRAKKNLKIAKSRYNKAKYNFKKHHSKKNKKSLSKANHNLKVAKSKYSALTK